jgi:protein-tyrosine sulfotransferase
MNDTEPDSPTRAERAGLPIFVIGCHRSGTTLMRYILDTHPAIACPPESKYLEGLIPFFRYPRAVRGVFGLGGDELQIAFQFHRLARSFLDEYAEQKGKRRWADKTPNYYRIVEFIDGLFARQVLFVYLVRHPLDVIPSLSGMMTTEVFGGHDDPYLTEIGLRHGTGEYGAARYWLDVNERLNVFAACTAERVFVVRYEDVVTRTEETLAALFDFLGEDFSPALIQKVFEAEHDDGFGFGGIKGRTAITSDRVGKWHEWPARKRELLWELVEPVARHFGYGIGDHDGVLPLEELRDVARA